MRVKNTRILHNVVVDKPIKRSCSSSYSVPLVDSADITHHPMAILKIGNTPDWETVDKLFLHILKFDSDNKIVFLAKNKTCTNENQLFPVLELDLPLNHEVQCQTDQHSIKDFIINLLVLSLFKFNFQQNSLNVYFDLTKLSNVYSFFNRPAQVKALFFVMHSIFGNVGSNSSMRYDFITDNEDAEDQEVTETTSDDDDAEKEIVEDDDFLLDPVFENVLRRIKTKLMSQTEYEEFNMPSEIITKPLLHQASAVRFMLDIEHGSYQLANYEERYLTEYELVNLDGSKRIFYFWPHMGSIGLKKHVFEAVHLKGGILADQMGLGKSLSVICTILMNPCPASLLAKTSSTNEKITDAPTNDESPEIICFCGEDGDMSDLIKCSDCSTWQHAKCLDFNPVSTSERPYECPKCVVKSPFLSKATVIVCPEELAYQWKNQFEIHLAKKVAILQYQNWIHPSSFCRYDLVIVSIQTLKRELNHFRLKCDQAPRVRRQSTLRAGNGLEKKFLNAPSCLLAVKFWRLVIDECQFVCQQSIQYLAGKLSFHKVWCVSGTPIIRSFEDLQPLVSLIDYHPFDSLQKWRYHISNPIANRVLHETNVDASAAKRPRLALDCEEPLLRLLRPIFWRTLHSDLTLTLPAHFVKFFPLHITPVEEQIYRTAKRSEFKNLQKYETMLKQNCEGDDCTMSTKIYNQKVCGGPLHQLIRLAINPKIKTVGGRKGASLCWAQPATSHHDSMVKVLQRNKTEIEDLNRVIVSDMLGIAALKEEIPEKVHIYRRVFSDTQKMTTDFGIKTDSIQLIHACHNLAALLPEGDAEKNTLIERKTQLRNAFLQTSTSNFQVKLKLFDKSRASLSENTQKFRSVTWFLDFLKDFAKTSISHEELLQSIGRQIILGGHANTAYGAEQLSFTLRDIASAATYINKLFTTIETCQSSYFESLGQLQKLLEKNNNNDETLTQLKKCCLTVNKYQKAKKSSCLICKTEKAFKQFESALFKNSETTSYQRLAPGEDVQVSNWGDGKFIRIIRFLGSLLSSNTCGKRYQTDYQRQLAQFKLLRATFKNAGALFTSLIDRLNASDELYQAECKLSTTSELSTVAAAHSNVRVVSTLEAETMLHRMNASLIVSRKALETSCHQFNYAKSLEQVDDEKRECPVCRIELTNFWVVLECAHTLCRSCAGEILKIQKHSNGGGQSPSITCPICREKSHQKDCLTVSSGKLQAETDVHKSVKNSKNFATKIVAIVHYISTALEQNPDHRFIIFSSFNDIATEVFKLLDQNDIRAVSGSHSRVTVVCQAISNFCQDASIKCLLLNLRHGSNGLNLICADHVIFVDPPDSKSQVSQAVSRVHRLGQTKPTVAVWFPIVDTIDGQLTNLVTEGLDNDEQPAEKKEKGKISIRQILKLCSNEIQTTDQIG